MLTLGSCERKFYHTPDKLEEEVLRDLGLVGIVRNLVEACEPLAFIYSSPGRNEAGPAIDYDLMVIVPDDAPPERHHSRTAYERLWATDRAVNVVI